MVAATKIQQHRNKMNHTTAVNNNRVPHFRFFLWIQKIVTIKNVITMILGLDAIT